MKIEDKQIGMGELLGVQNKSFQKYKTENTISVPLRPKRSIPDTVDDFVTPISGALSNRGNY